MDFIDPHRHCRYCKQTFASKASLRRHIRRTHDDSYLREIEALHRTCPYCKNQFENRQRLGGHMCLCSARPDRKQVLRRLSESHKGNTHSPEVKKRIRKSMQGAVRDSPESYSAENVCGRVKRIKVVDSFGTQTTVHGRWERDVATFFNERAIRWRNDVQGFSYQWKGREHLYFPDFYLPDFDVYVEVKGFERSRDRAKWSSFPKPLILIRKPEIREIRDGLYELGL